MSLPGVSHDALRGKVRGGAQTLHRRRSWPGARGPLAGRAASVVLGLLVWEIVGRWVVTNPILFAPPSRVAMAAWPLLQNGRLARDIAISLGEFAAGFALAAVCGIAAGVGLALSSRWRTFAEPWIDILYSSPLVALMPFFILVFGIGMASKIAIVTTVAIIPILYNTLSGVRGADPAWLDVARVYHCSRAQVLTRILLPAALPSIVVGLRLGIGRGLTGVAVGELFAAQGGLGYLITTAGQSFDTPTLLLGVALFSLIGIVLISLLGRIRTHVDRNARGGIR
ncbi:ABC transporter permease [Caballeronia sp. LZ034LL]|uniref:ABC transporter permease n=1 Tax=Caballeronia sp. LZ034LL TaxID=3038567 RepID=UPI002858F87A|nr:ABC transporter permease [Caballeronia sp. LZ034LL]MDR5836053.1 ABC transporter permease [Caballeronia sp. LZ034LL]